MHRQTRSTRVGRAVRNLRMQRGLTYKQFAARLGVSWQYVSHIEIGRAGMSLAMAAKLAKHFKPLTMRDWMWLEMDDRLEMFNKKRKRK